MISKAKVSNTADSCSWCTFTYYHNNFYQLTLDCNCWRVSWSLLLQSLFVTTNLRLNLTSCTTRRKRGGKKSLWNITWKVEYRPKRPSPFFSDKRNWQTWQSQIVYYWGPTKNHFCDWVPACNIIVIILTNTLIITIMIIIIIITIIIKASY